MSEFNFSVPLGRLSAESDPLNNTTRYEYADEHSDLPQVTEDPAGGRRQMVWTPYGQLARYRDCSEKVTEYDYDRWGQLIAQRQEEGMHSQQTYDARGRLIRSENATGERTEYAYNDAGDLISITYPDQSQAEMRYNPWGAVVVNNSRTVLNKPILMMLII